MSKLDSWPSNTTLRVGVEEVWLVRLREASLEANGLATNIFSAEDQRMSIGLGGQALSQAQPMFRMFWPIDFWGIIRCLFSRE